LEHCENVSIFHTMPMLTSINIGDVQSRNYTSGNLAIPRATTLWKKMFLFANFISKEI